ncbi:hypothetical protein DMENIID0001_030600 [Sergentomyia squamirostris]
MASINVDNVAGSGDDGEEIYLYVDFNSIPLSDEFNDPDELKFKIVGLESENPVIQINNKFFKGEYQDTIGTNLFFEQEGNQPEFDAVFRKNPEKTYKYMTKTNKSLVMKRIFLESQDREENRSEEAANSVENSSKYQVTKTYQETLCQLVSVGRKPPHVMADCLDDKVRSTQEVAQEYHDLDLPEDRKPLHFK